MSVFRNVKRWLRQESTLGYILVAPLLLWILGVFVYPIISTVVSSFENAKLTSLQSQFVGLRNYLRILGPEYGFWNALGKSLVFTGANVVLHLVIGLIVALLLNRTFTGKTFVRTWIFVPWVIPFVVMAIMWRWMLHGSMGVFNFFLVSLGLIDKPIAFLGDPQFAMATIVGVFTWRSFPLPALVFLAALQMIPREQYEAAETDGANRLQRLLFIVGPHFFLSFFFVFWSVYLDTEPITGTE